MKRLNEEICEIKYFENKDKLEDLLITTFVGMFIICLLIKLGWEYLPVTTCLKYTCYLAGVPYTLRRFTGEIDIVPSIFGIILFLIVMAIFFFVGSIVTLFMFVHFACQTGYYYRHLKKFEKERNAGEINV